MVLLRCVVNECHEYGTAPAKMLHCNLRGVGKGTTLAPSKSVKAPCVV